MKRQGEEASDSDNNHEVSYTFVLLLADARRYERQSR